MTIKYLTIYNLYSHLCESYKIHYLHKCGFMYIYLQLNVLQQWTSLFSLFVLLFLYTIITNYNRRTLHDCLQLKYDCGLFKEESQFSDFLEDFDWLRIYLHQWSLKEYIYNRGICTSDHLILHRYTSIIVHMRLSIWHTAYTVRASYYYMSFIIYACIVIWIIMHEQCICMHAAHMHIICICLFNQCSAVCTWWYMI